jgi:hypothetical protein
MNYTQYKSRLPRYKEMIMSTISQKNSNASYPWEKKVIKPGLKILAVLGLLFFPFCAFPQILSALIVLPLSSFSDNPILSLVLLLIGVALLGLSVWGMIKIWRYAAAPTDYKLPVSSSDPRLLGHSFTVKFGKIATSRSFTGSGSLRFSDEGLRLSGRAEPTVIFQLGVILIVTIIPLVIFGWGFGIIPALLIAAYFGREDMDLTVPYDAIQKLAIDGRNVVLDCPPHKPKKFKFRVALGDGERFYRELYNHYPQATTAWQEDLALLFDTSSPDTDPIN